MLKHKIALVCTCLLLLQSGFNGESGYTEPKPASPVKAVTGQQALNAARKSGQPALVAKAYFQIGSKYQQQGQIAKARTSYTEGLAYARKTLPATHPMIGLLLCQISTTYMYEQDFDRAIPALNEGLTILNQNPQMGQIALKLTTLRDIVLNFSDGLKALKRYEYAQSETHFQQALTLGTQVQEPSLISVAQSSLGLSQLMQDKFETAEASLAQALQYSEKTHMREARLMALIAYASLYSRQGQVETARMYYQDALSEPAELFNRIQVPKALFEQEIGKLDHIRDELAQTTVNIENPDYYDDMLWKRNVFHWNTRNGTIRVYLKPVEGVQGWTPEYRERFKAACKQWQLALGDRVRFYFTDNPAEPADVTVIWNDGYDKLVGLTRCKHYAGQLVNAGITLNLKSYDNQLYAPETMYRISLHEVGHLLGLMGHSRSPKDIMFPSLSMATGLSSRDTATVRKLYRMPAQITNPERMTLSEYRKTPGYQAIQPQIESLKSH